jgi:hypothetical protein
VRSGLYGNKPVSALESITDSSVLSFEIRGFCSSCLCTACQVGPDHEVMKRPDRVKIGEAQGIVGMHNGCRDEQRAYWRMASEQR